jgi:hypothetical protein
MASVEAAPAVSLPAMKLWILQKATAAGPAYEDLRFREDAR